MKCDGCKALNSKKTRDGKIQIDCRKNGQFTLSTDFRDAFNCENFVKNDREPQKPPKEPNVIIILNSGRDIALYLDPEKLSKDNLLSLCASSRNISTDECYVRGVDISALLFVGGKNDEQGAVN